MKLLFDANLSPRLVDGTRSAFPGSMHVEDTVGVLADDETIWRFAAANGFVIATKDNDFLELSAIFGAPPKLVLLEIGNTSTRETLRILIEHERDLKSFNVDPDPEILIVGR